MDIQVRDEQQALSSCSSGKSNQKELSAAINNLEALLKKFNSAWESTGQDKETYILELEKQINNLRIIGDASLKFFNSIESYIHRVQQAKARTLDGGTGTSGGGKFSEEQIKEVLEEDQKRIESDARAGKYWIENMDK